MLVDPPVYILIHVALSLVGIFAGLVVVGGLVAGVRLPRATGIFLVTTVLTNLTGFGFPFITLLPSHIVGALSLVVLLGAIGALYWKRLAGAWRQAFVVLSVTALYLNVFVLVAQLFQKVRPLTLLAPDPGSPVFAATQGFVLLLFVVLGRAASTGFRRGDAVA